jgi:hypothetical protein
MNAIRFWWFRTGYLAAAACLTIGASCALQGPGLMRAVMTVGTDVQLPLERIATDNRAHAQSPVHSWKQSSHRTDANTRAPRPTSGYLRTITDFKYWT